MLMQGVFPKHQVPTISSTAADAISDEPALSTLQALSHANQLCCYDTQQSISLRAMFEA